MLLKSQGKRSSGLMLHFTFLRFPMAATPYHYSMARLSVKIKGLPDLISIRVSNKLFASPLLSIKKRKDYLEADEKENCHNQRESEKGFPALTTPSQAAFQH